MRISQPPCSALWHDLRTHRYHMTADTFAPRCTIQQHISCVDNKVLKVQASTWDGLSAIIARHTPQRLPAHCNDTRVDAEGLSIPLAASAFYEACCDDALCLQ